VGGHGEEAPEEAGIDQRLELAQARQEQLVLYHAMPNAGLCRGACDIERVLERLGDRLLAVDVLASGDRLAQQLRAQLGGGSIEEQRVFAVRKRGVEIGGPARDAVGLGEVLELTVVAADQERVGAESRAV